MQAMEDRELIVKTSAYIDCHREEMLSLWEKIVSIESGTPDKEGVDRVRCGLKGLNWKVPEWTTSCDPDGNVSETS